MSPEEIADYQLGELIHTIGKITWDNLMDWKEAMRVYEIIKPSLDYQQQSAWEIIDLMQQEEDAA